MADNALLRIGKISAFNYPNGTARITYEDKDGSTTVEMPFMSWQYWMPKVGDQVLVAHLSSGTTAAVILGPVWHDGHRPMEGFEGLYRREYSNQRGLANERYDANEHTYHESITGTAEIKTTKDWSVKVDGDATLQLSPGGKILGIASDSLTLTIGPCKVEIKSDGTIKIVAPTKIDIDTPLITVTGDVIADGKKVSLAHHKHPGDSGGKTGEPD